MEEKLKKALAEVEGLSKALSEVEEVSERMIEQLRWNSNERSTKIQEMATAGHEPSQQLITHFKLWYIGMKFDSPMYVERTEELITHFKEYREAGYVE